MAPITNVRNATITKAPGLIGGIPAQIDVYSGASKCVTCGKLMPRCWDTVCADCGDTSCYADSKLINNYWFCAKCAKATHHPLTVVRRRYPGDQPFDVPAESPKQVEDRKAVGIERLLNRLFDHRVIVNCDRDPYLLRWYVIRTERFSLFIHKFVRSDEDRSPHSHPWPFIVIPIWRGYIEHTFRKFTLPILPWRADTTPTYWATEEDGSKVLRLHECRRVWPLISSRWRPATFQHRVELIARDGRLLPSWSLFIHFRREREWGFHPPEGFIHWKAWWSEKCE